MRLERILFRPTTLRGRHRRFEDVQKHRQKQYARRGLPADTAPPGPADDDDDMLDLGPLPRENVLGLSWEAWQQRLTKLREEKARRDKKARRRQRRYKEEPEDDEGGDANAGADVEAASPRRSGHKCSSGSESQSQSPRARRKAGGSSGGSAAGQARHP